MSTYVSGFAWRSKICSQQKLVLLAFADVADDEGYCVFRKGAELTRAGLAEKTSLSERTIQREIAALLDPETGLLEITKPAAQHAPPEYRVKIERLEAMDKIIRGDRQSPLSPVENSSQGRQTVSSEPCGKLKPGETGSLPSAIQGRQPRHPGETASLPTYKVLDVNARKSLSHVLTTAEREMVTKDLKRIFPELESIPNAISTERAFLFLHKVRMGEIRKEQLYSPVAYMTKLLDEDITQALAKWRATRGRGG